MTVEELRSQFPELSEKVYGKRLIYLDNAATSQRPLSVVRKWTEMSTVINSNLHRAVHRLANLATEEYENTRKAVANYINASGPDEIVFTSGTTHSVNLLAFSFGEAFVGEGDEIVVSEVEHHSDIVPWQMLCQRKGAVLKVLPVLEDGTLDIASLPSLLSEKVKIVCVAHISNVLGIVNPIAEIARICHSSGCPLFVDGAQGIVHADVDVQALGCDFYAFSGHKIYAAPGTGVLYGKREWLDKLPPYMGGGEMIETVRWSGTTYAKVPHRFEAGTQNISGVPTLVPALDLSTAVADGETKASLETVRDYVMEALKSRGDVRIFGDPAEKSLKVPVFSFCVDGVHHEDLALILDKMGVAVRSGQMCAEPLMDRFGVTGMLRASFAPYNTLEEAEMFVASLDRAIKMLR